jgi:carbamoyl-phosphate synthase large subunit
LMFLEYLDKDKYQEFTCDLYYGKDSHLKCVVPRKRIEVRDGEVNKGKTEKNILIDFIYERLKIINGARGCLTAQFFKHKESEKIIGIEINPRFGGGYPLSYKAGANYPKWIIEEYLLDKTIEPYDAWKDNLLMLRYDKEVFVENSDA